MRGFGNQIIFPQHDDRKIVPRAENNYSGIPLIRAATPIKGNTGRDQRSLMSFRSHHLLHQCNKKSFLSDAKLTVVDQ